MIRFFLKPYYEIKQFNKEVEIIEKEIAMENKFKALPLLEQSRILINVLMSYSDQLAVMPDTKFISYNAKCNTMNYIANEIINIIPKVEKLGVWKPLSHSHS